MKTFLTKASVNFGLFGFVFTIMGVMTSPAQEWGYHGELGAVNWCSIDEDFTPCCDGLAQSPIDVESSIAQYTTLDPLEYNYQPVDLNVINNGHTIEANVPTNSCFLTIGGVTYQLLQFHFHTASEHLLNGEEFPMEVHLVHQAEDGSLAVTGTMIDLGSSHDELNKFWHTLPGEENSITTVTDFDVTQLVPQQQTSYRYSGSLTTPPCSETVSWIVFNTPITMSSEQIGAFMELYSGELFPDGNRRPIQPLNARTIFTDVPPTSNLRNGVFDNLK